MIFRFADNDGLADGRDDEDFHQMEYIDYFGSIQVHHKFHSEIQVVCQYRT
jgi:hypothetical protein